MAEGIIIGDPMFESSIRHPVYGDYHSRRGDKLLCQLESLREELGISGLDPIKKSMKQAILARVVEELCKCGPYYAEKAGIVHREYLEVNKEAIAATPKGREFLAGPPKRLKH
jgi:hypothetical protein